MELANKVHLEAIAFDVDRLAQVLEFMEIVCDEMTEKVHIERYLPSMMGLLCHEAGSISQKIVELRKAPGESV